MKKIVFYSWQSDLPNPCNRGFIQAALENVVATIKADDTIEVEPVVDRDTLGVPGAPDIASTIFAKIAASDVFVADVSITGRSEKRATPNPNVLIELGYALKALGYERVVLVFNRAFGKIEELPFDLKMRRLLVYDMALEAKERSPERKVLEKQLDLAIRTGLTLPSDSDASPSIPGVAAIESQTANRIIVLRRNLGDILNRLVKLEPKKPRDGGTVEELIAAMSSTQETVAEFSKIAEAAALMNDLDAALEIHRWFGGLFERYDLPENFAGTYHRADHDYFKFLGHELYVTFVAFILKEQRWTVLRDVLAEPMPMRYLRRDHGPRNADWRFGSEHLHMLIDESPKTRRLSLHADLLDERHTTAGLAAIMPMEDFMAADYFLFLLGEMSHKEMIDGFFDWRPWSALYLKRVPTFLRNAEHKRIADQIIKVFNLDTIDEFRSRLAQCSPLLGKLFSGGWWDNPIRAEDIGRIGTR